MSDLKTNLDSILSKVTSCINKTDNILHGMQYISYLESTGAQCIDTGVKSKSNLKIDITFLATKNVNDYQTIFGSRSEVNNYRGLGFDVENRGEYSVNYNGENKFRKTIDLFDKKCNILMDNNVVTLTLLDLENDNQQIMTAATSSDFEYDYPIYLFALNSGNNVVSQSSAKIYECKIFDNNVLVRHFVPVKDENGEPCLYDIITMNFYYNLGSGEFIAGERI